MQLEIHMGAGTFDGAALLFVSRMLPDWRTKITNKAMSPVDLRGPPRLLHGEAIGGLEGVLTV